MVMTRAKSQVAAIRAFSTKQMLDGDQILNALLLKPRPGTAIIADIITQKGEWAGVACGVVANPGPNKNTISATIAPVIRTMVGLDKYVECGFRADIQFMVGKSQWFIFENKANPGTVLIEMKADVIPPMISSDFYLP